MGHKERKIFPYVSLCKMGDQIEFTFWNTNRENDIETNYIFKMSFITLVSLFLIKRRIKILIGT